MSAVWFCIPSARPAVEANRALALWRSKGYQIALWRDSSDNPPIHDLLLSGPYPGYAGAVNALAREVLADQPDCHWIVAGGDDTEPDPHAAEVIAEQCERHFQGSFGVMQPTGDRFAEGQIDRIAGSPWLGREFCHRMYGGQGPLFEGYKHCFVDEELQNVAIKLGVFWQRPDLIHRHMHFQRESDAIGSRAVSRPVPVHLEDAFSAPHWAKYSALFRQRKADGFPGHEPTCVTSAT